MRAVPFALLLLGAAACGEPKKAAPADDLADDLAGPPVALVGIDPERWTCDQVATEAAVSAAVGGPVRPVDSSMPAPRGTARSCNYLLDGAVPEAWTFDLDCRPGALRTAATLWKQYTEQNLALIAAYSDAGAEELTSDAGTVQHAPGAPVEVAVGARALDHNGQALLFVDDDTECYGRVVGPDAARRLVLAQLVATNLHPSSAPMDPRPAGK